VVQGIRGHIRNNVVGYIALFFALGLGTAWAAGLAKDSVRSKQIKDGQVKTKDLRDDAVTSPKVADGSLLKEDFAAGQLPRGEQGLPGKDAANLFAYVGASGNLIYGKGATESARTDPGAYTVYFDRSLAGCVAMANVGRGNPPGEYGTAVGGYAADAYVINDTSVDVVVTDPSLPEYFNEAFQVAVFC
jgi:hypothetical protein